MASDYSVRQGSDWPEVDDVHDFGALIDQANIGHAEEYGFEDLTEMYEFWTGTGRYDDQEGWAKVDDFDLERERREMQQSVHKCPACVDEVAEYLAEGAMRGEVDRDPTMETQYWTNERESFKTGEDEVREHNFMIYCEDHPDVHAEFEVREYLDAE